VFVLALIVRVFHGAYDEASGLEASLPCFLAEVGFQVADQAVGPRRGGGFPTIPAGNFRAFSVHVSLGVVAALERCATVGTTVSVLLLDRLSSGTRCFDRGACHGEGGGQRRHDGGVEGTGIVIDELRRRIIIDLRSAGGWGRATTTKFGFRCVRAPGTIIHDIPLAAAVVGDQVRIHGGVIHTGGKRLTDRCYDSFVGGLFEQPWIHPRCVQH
jgi:hypothetical protein